MQDLYLFMKKYLILNKILFPNELVSHVHHKKGMFTCYNSQVQVPNSLNYIAIKINNDTFM